MTTLYENVYDRPGHRMNVSLVESGLEYQAVVQFFGKGSMDGVHALIQMLNEMLSVSPVGVKAKAILDTSQLDSAPLRSQLILAKWMLQNRAQVDRIVIVGAKPMIRRLASAVLRAARFDQVQFVRNIDEAAAWIGFRP